MEPKKMYCQKKEIDNDNSSQISTEIKIEMCTLHLET